METKQELGAVQKRWVAELRSGNWTQGREFLCRKGAYCCLGVACEMLEIEKVEEGNEGVVRFGPSWDSWASLLPSTARDLLALRADGGGGVDGRSLAAMNDFGATFAQIADAIEANPGNWFTESK